MSMVVHLDRGRTCSSCRSPNVRAAFSNVWWFQFCEDCGHEEGEGDYAERLLRRRQEVLAKWRCPECDKTLEVNAVQVVCNGNNGTHKPVEMVKEESDG